MVTKNYYSINNNDNSRPVDSKNNKKFTPPVIKIY